MPLNFSYVKRRHHAALLFCGFLLGLVAGSKSEHSLQPTHIVTATGHNAVFTCKTDISHTATQWILSGARQPMTDIVYEGSIHESYKLKVDVFDTVSNGRLTTQITIKNVTVHEAGTVFCREDGAFGNVIAAKLSVVQDIGCVATCAKDHLLVTCEACYWSEDGLYFILQYREDFKPQANSEDFNDLRNCLQLKALWDIKTSCKDLNESQIVIKITENSTKAQLSTLVIITGRPTSNHNEENHPVDEFMSYSTNSSVQITQENVGLSIWMSIVIMTAAFPLFLILLLVTLVLFRQNSSIVHRENFRNGCEEEKGTSKLNLLQNASLSESNDSGCFDYV